MDYMCHSARDLRVKLLMGFNSFFIQIHSIEWEFSCSVLSIWFVKGDYIKLINFSNAMLINLLQLCYVTIQLQLYAITIKLFWFYVLLSSEIFVSFKYLFSGSCATSTTC